MTEKVAINTFISSGKTFWPLYLLGGLLKERAETLKSQKN